MMQARQILAIAIKELKVLWRDRQALALLFLMPTFFILVMSFALEGVFETGTKERPIEILVVNQDRGELAGKTIAAASGLEGFTLIQSLHGVALTAKSAEGEIRAGRYHFALIFDPGYSERLLEASPADVKKSPVKIVADPTINQQLQTLITSVVGGIVERTRLAARLPEKMRALTNTPLPNPLAPNEPTSLIQPAPAASNEFETLVKDAMQPIDIPVTPPAGFNRERRPTATEQNVPAYAIFGVFFIVLTIAKSFVRERQDGTFVRLMTAPVGTGVLLLGKLAPYYLVNLLQVALMFAVGAAVFDMKLGNLPAFLLITLATSAAANALGLLVAAVSTNEVQADTLSVLLAITLAALGGIMVPTFVMPETLQTLARFTSHAWALAGYQDVIVRGLSFADVAPKAAVLAGFGVGFFALALWRLRLN